MTVAYWDRIGSYIHQNRAPRLTPPQVRRIRHKQNRTSGPVPDPWGWVTPAAPAKTLSGVSR